MEEVRKSFIGRCIIQISCLVYRDNLLSPSAGRANALPAEGGNTYGNANWGDQLTTYSGTSFTYDANGSPIGMQYRTTSYAEGVFDVFWFEKNLQGDIIAVYNDAGTLLVQYTYDAWGNTVSTTYYNGGSGTIVRNNRFRYRSYYYDTETGFYYLNSRYYDPGTGRFLNADVYTSTGQGLLGNNMYAYCLNNPVMCTDPDGNYCYSYLNAESMEHLRIMHQRIGSSGSVSVGTIPPLGISACDIAEGIESVVLALWNPIDAFFNSIEAEAGLGTGIDFNICGLGGGVSNDTFIGFDDGEITTGHQALLSMILASTTGKHYAEKGNKRLMCPNCGWDYSYKTVFDYLKCPHTEIADSLTLGPFSYDTKGNFVISGGVSAHLIFGGYINVGFNVTEFLERLFD